MAKKIFLYTGITFNLFFYTFLAKDLPVLSLFLLGIFFTLILTEKILKPTAFLKQIRYIKEQLNRYYRRYILYTWLAFCFLVSFSILLPTPPGEENVSAAIPQVIETPVMATKPISEIKVTNIAKKPADKTKEAAVKKIVPIKKTIEKPIYLVHVNTKSGIYHGPGCQFYDCENCNLYMSDDEAKKRGFRHCQKE